MKVYACAHTNEITPEAPDVVERCPGTCLQVDTYHAKCCLCGRTWNMWALSTIEELEPKMVPCEPGRWEDAEPSDPIDDINELLNHVWDSENAVQDPGRIWLPPDAYQKLVGPMPILERVAFEVRWYYWRWILDPLEDWRDRRRWKREDNQEGKK